MMVPCPSQHEADFLLGMLNSSPSLLTIHSYVISTSTSTHVLSNIAIPRFIKLDSKHAKLAELSSQCHIAKRKNKQNEVVTLEAEIDEVAAGIWGISDIELKAIQKALADM